MFRHRVGLLYRFDASKCLPQNIIIKWAETQLYRIGLNFDSFDYVVRDLDTGLDTGSHC